jgi:hypothetical protein
MTTGGILPEIRLVIISARSFSITERVQQGGTVAIFVEAGHVVFFWLLGGVLHDFGSLA